MNTKTSKYAERWRKRAQMAQEGPSRRLASPTPYLDHQEARTAYPDAIKTIQAGRLTHPFDYSAIEVEMGPVRRLFFGEVLLVTGGGCYELYLLNEDYQRIIYEDLNLLELPWQENTTTFLPRLAELYKDVLLVTKELDSDGNKKYQLSDKEILYYRKVEDLWWLEVLPE